jgi:hypothetical protein
MRSDDLEKEDSDLTTAKESDDNVLGCTYASADNFQSNATVDDGSCSFGNCPQKRMYIPIHYRQILLQWSDPNPLFLDHLISCIPLGEALQLGQLLKHGSSSYFGVI